MMPPHRHAVFLLLFLCCWAEGMTLRLAAAEYAASTNAPVSVPATITTAVPESNATPHFNVAAYTVEGNPLLSTNVLLPMLSKHTGTNVSLEEIVKAASDLQLEYRNQGYPAMSVALAREQITNGIVKLNVFPTAVPQIVVSGIRYLSSTNNTEVVSNPSAAEATSAPKPMATFAATTNVLPLAISHPTVPANPGEMAEARAVLLKKMAELDVQEKDRRVHVVSTNAGPRFEVEKYLVIRHFRPFAGNHQRRNHQH